MIIDNGDEVLTLIDDADALPPEVYTDAGGQRRWGKQEVVLETYVETGNPVAGCAAAGISIRSREVVAGKPIRLP